MGASAAFFVFGRSVGQDIGGGLLTRFVSCWLFCFYLVFGGFNKNDVTLARLLDIRAGLLIPVRNRCMRMSLVSRTLNIMALMALALPYHAAAEDECVNRYTELNICNEARRLSEGIARELPMRLSQRMIWDSTSSYGNTLQGHIMYTYDREHLESIAETSGMSISQMEEAVHQFARGMCAEEMIKAFVRVGGKIKFVYRFSDGEKFTEVVVNEC